MGTPGVVDPIERVDLGLQFRQGVGERLLVEVAEESLVGALILALGSGRVGPAGNRLDPESGGVRNERPVECARRGARGAGRSGEGVLEEVDLLGDECLERLA